MAGTRVSFSIDEQLAAQIKEIAREQRRTMPSICRQAVYLYFGWNESERMMDWGEEDEPDES